MFSRMFQQKQGATSLSGTPAVFSGARGRPMAGELADAGQLSLAQRIMARLGLLHVHVGTTPVAPAPAPDPGLANVPPGSQAVHPARSRQAIRVHAETALLESVIGARLPALSSLERQRHQRMLDNLLQHPDLPARTRLLRMVAASVAACMQQEQARPAVRSVWRALPPAPARVNYESVVADLLRKKERELLDLRFAMLRLPPDLLIRYQTVLADLLASRHRARRNALLARMARQVALSVRRNEDHPDFRPGRGSRA